MEIIDFKPGPQIATSISNILVRDLNGVVWTVLKNMTNATAQPYSGSYYTKYSEPAFDYKAAYEGLLKRVVALEQRPVMAADVFNFDPRDFFIDVDTKLIKKRL